MKNLNGFQKIMFVLVLSIIFLLGLNIKKTNELIEMKKSERYIDIEKIYEIINSEVSNECNLIADDKKETKKNLFVERFKELENAYPQKTKDELLTMMP